MSRTTDISTVLTAFPKIRCFFKSIADEARSYLGPEKEIKRVQFIRNEETDPADCLVHFENAAAIHFKAQQVQVKNDGSFEATSIGDFVYLFTAAPEEKHSYATEVSVQMVSADRTHVLEDGLVLEGDVFDFRTYDHKKPPVGFKLVDLHGSNSVICKLHQTDTVQDHAGSEDATSSNTEEQLTDGPFLSELLGDATYVTVDGVLMQNYETGIDLDKSAESADFDQSLSGVAVIELKMADENDWIFHDPRSFRSPAGRVMVKDIHGQGHVIHTFVESEATKMKTTAPEPVPATSDVQYSVDGGTTWLNLNQDVRVCYDVEVASEGPHHLIAVLTHEGIVWDLFDSIEGTVTMTSSSLLPDIIETLN